MAGPSEQAKTSGDVVGFLVAEAEEDPVERESQVARLLGSLLFSGHCFGFWACFGLRVVGFSLYCVKGCFKFGFVSGLGFSSGY